MLKRWLIVAVMMFVVACGKNPNGPDDSGGSGGSGSGGTTLNGSTFQLSVVGGPTFTPNVIQVSVQPSVFGSPEYLAMTVGSSQNAGFAFYVPTAIDTYSVTGSIFSSVVYSENSGATSASWEAKIGVGGSGTIQVTARTATTISGKFSVTAIATTGASTGSKVITGSFTAKVS